MLKKYITIIKTEFQRQLTYRMDFLGFRLANMIEISAQLIIWTIIYKNIDIISGYTYKEMVSYVLIGWLILFLRNSYGFEDNIAKDIHLGRLSNYLIKPISYLKYMCVLSVARVSIATSTSLFLMAFLIIIFHNLIVPPPSILSVIVILLMVVLAYYIRLFLAILVGFIAFWSNEINGIYKGLNFLIKFLSGSYFPINLLPSIFLQISLCFPFVYILFFPVQLYLGKISLIEGLRGLGVEIIWLFLLYGIIKLVWKRGLKKYESVGI